MTRQSLIRIVAGVAVAGFVGLTAGPAFATTPSTRPTVRATAGTGAAPTSPTVTQTAALAAIQAAAKAAIGTRLTDLNAVIGVLNGLATCSVGPLVATANADIAGLTALEATIAADTTAQQARTDAQTIFTTYRVFALVIPVDNMVRATCVLTDVTTKLTALETKWGTVTDPQVQALLADMTTQTTAAAAAVNGLPAELEDYTPTQWNADHGLLDGARGSLKTARQDLENVRQDARKIVAILKSDHQQKGQSSVSSSTTASTVAAG